MSKPSSNGEIPSVPPGVKLTTLDNGLIIIVREDHNAPVVSAQAWAMSGSIHEGNWLGGETIVSFDKKAVSLIVQQGQQARLLA